MVEKDRMIYQVEETRTELIAKALDLFVTKGFFETKMTDVAREAGVSRHTLYRYFQDKTDLALSIVEELFGSSFDDDLIASEIREGGVSGLEKIRLYIKRQWLDEHKIKERRFLAEFDAYYSGSRIRGDFSKRLENLFSPAQVETVEKYVAEGQKDGSVSADIDPHLAMVTIINSIRGLDQRLLLRGESLIELKPGDEAKMRELLINMLIAGIANTHKA